MDAVKFEIDSLEENNGIYFDHTGHPRSTVPRYHDFIMIAYVAHGCGFHKIDNEAIPVEEGDIFIVKPNVVHCFFPAEHLDFIEIYYCFFIPEMISNLWNDLKNDFIDLRPFFENTSIKYIHVKDSANKEIRNLFVRALHEFIHYPTGYKNMIPSYFSIILTTILRQSSHALNNPVFNQNKIVDHAIRYINYNLYFKLTVKDIAEANHVSESHLIRLFKKHTGLTVVQFINNLKIEKAKDLLKNTDRSIESISVALNCNARYLRRLFKKHTGMTLDAFRKKYHYKS